MPDHLIRLRGGWERLGDAPQRLTLPITGPPSLEGGVRLGRWFQTPKLDPIRETLWLRLDVVPGLKSVSCNDVEIARGPFSSTPVLLPLRACLGGRNRIVLDVGFPSPPAVPPDDGPWGEVALVIRGG